ncbi:MAG: FG-GAP-like repeat-containing protein [Clostridia bacterium]|nr:FG-GAP-like repeat-containing protein [Clostridia bacterium]
MTPTSTPVPTVSPTLASTASPTPIPAVNAVQPPKPANTPTPVPTPTSIPVVYLVPKKVNAARMVFDASTMQVSGDVIVEVANRGPDDVPSKFKLLIFEDANLNHQYDSGDAVLGSKIMENTLKANQTARETVTVKGTVLFRDNLVYAFVDSEDSIKETDEENNVLNSKVDCKVDPVVGSFNPVLEWEWTNSSVSNPSSNQVMCAPVVARLHDDNRDGQINQYDVPCVIFNTFAGSEYSYNGTLRVIRGSDGKELFKVTGYETLPGTNPAVGNIDSDGIPEIIAIEEFHDYQKSARVLVFENNGEFKWASEYLSFSGTFSGIASPAIADVDGDGKAEIILGSAVINADGSTRWKGTAGFGRLNSVAADVYGDKAPEIITGDTVYTNEGRVVWQKKEAGDGFTAVADFDSDPYGEIVVVSLGYITLLDNTGDIIWGPMPIPPGNPTNNQGGPPTVADFDKDGKPEIGIAGGYYYTVFETDGSVKWKSPTKDHSSNCTGSSVFDFEGDGKAEDIYSDESYLRIYNGMDGTILFQTYIGSGTLIELPVIVDVDNDNNAEIVVASNSYAFGGSTGIQVFGDKTIPGLIQGKSGISMPITLRMLMKTVRFRE